MISLLLGLLAAFGYSAHDLLARRFANEFGPFRLALGVLVAGAALLLVPVLWRGQIWHADGFSVAMALAMGVVYAVALGGLLVAFSMAPVSIVGPLTAGYPVLVVAWGLFNGLVPTSPQWAGIVAVLSGVIIVSRSGYEDGGTDAVAVGKMPVVIVSAILASVAFAAAVLMGQKATEGLGEVETTFVSRFPAAALMLLALMLATLRNRKQPAPMTRSAGLAMVAMAATDVMAVTAINASVWFPNRELGAMAISSYGGMSVVLAMLILKERVSKGQWIGIVLIVAGLAALSWRS